MKNPQRFPPILAAVVPPRQLTPKPAGAGRSLPEWRGKSPDSAIPPRVQDRIVLKHDGRCAKCDRILYIGRWACDHIVALINGGENRESNLQPLCISPCHSQKTAVDVAEKAKVYRVRSKHIGIKTKHRTIPGRKFDGTPIFSRLVTR